MTHVNATMLYQTQQIEDLHSSELPSYDIVCGLVWG